MQTARDPKIPHRRTIQLSDEAWRRVRVAAMMNDMSPSQAIEEIIMERLTQPTKVRL